MNVEDVISKIAESEAMAEDDVREIYEAKLEQVEEADFEGDKEKRAVKLLWGSFKRRQQSDSTAVEGVFLGSGDRYDAVDYSRSQALEAYQENPQKAIKEGKVGVACPPEEAENITGAGVQVVGEKNGWAIVAHPDNENVLQYNFADRDPQSGDIAGTDDGEGNIEEGWRLYPLDTREEFNSGDENPNYGMPQDKHQWRRRALGVFRYGDNDQVKIGNVTFSDDQSVDEPPLYEAVKFKARVDEGDDDELYIYSTSETEIEPNPELGEKIGEPQDLVMEYFGGTDYVHDIHSAYEWMHDQDGRQTIIVKASLYSMDLEPNSNDTLRLVIGDMDFSGTEMVDREATVWLPAWQKEYVDFAVDSDIYVVGRAQLRDAYDPEKGETTSEEKELVINGQGVFADPDAKIPREDDVEEVDEDDFDFEGGDEEAETDGGEGEEPEFEAGEGDW